MKKQNEIIKLLTDPTFTFLNKNTTPYIIIASDQ